MAIELTEEQKAKAAEQLKAINLFLTRFVKCEYWDSARAAVIELMRMSGETGVDMMAATKSKRVQDLEILASVYEATVYCMLPFFKHSEHHKIMLSQVSACAAAHEETMGEPSMYHEMVPRYNPPPVDK